MPADSSTTQPTQIYCSWDSRQSNEPLFATATQAKVWFLLEYPFRWNAKAFEESKIPVEVKAHLRSALKSIPQARIQLIKSNLSDFPKQISFFVASTQEDPGFVELVLSDYKDLLQLDLVRLAEQLKNTKDSNRKEPLFLVCTNGKRDLCCARHGRPVYTRLQSVKKSSAWQTTHVGGHRFAGNLLCFPHGLIYGRVEPSDVPLIVDAYSRGEIFLEKLRGRSCYSEFGQAAEYYLRMQTGITEVTAYRLLNIENISPEQAKVVFIDITDSGQHALLIGAQESGLHVFSSCQDQERSPVTQYKLIDYQFSQAKDHRYADSA